MQLKRQLQVIILGLVFFTFHPTAQAQVPEGTENHEQQAVIDLIAQEMRPAEINRRLAEAEQQVDKATHESSRAQWQHILQLLQMQLERLDALEAEFTLDKLEYPPDTPPFSLGFLDQTRNRYREYKETHSQLDKAQQAAEKRIEAVQQTYASKKQLHTELEGEGGTTRQIAAAELEHQLAMENLIYARLDARLINQRIKQLSGNLEQLGKFIPDIEKEVVFSAQDFNFRLDNIHEREALLQKTQEDTNEDLSRELSKPQAERIHIQALESLQVLLSEARSYLLFESRVWEERRALHGEELATGKIVQWREENALKHAEISELIRVKRADQRNHTKVLVEQEQEDSTLVLTGEADLPKNILARTQLAFDNLETSLELLNDHLADLTQISNIDKYDYYKEKARYVANSIWNMQLVVVQDRAITIGKIVTVIFQFILVLLIAKLIILNFLYKLLTTVRIREGIAYTFTQLLFYLTLLVLLFGVISNAGIPFHVFAFFGGALAIAAGFGSQKIVSSFMSGIVMLLEGSIRVGDMVQVDNSKGRVKSIGLRHTQVTTFNNVDILVPNTKFLEENVINWTLESELIRSDITVGVDFNAPVETVLETLVQVAADHSDVIDDPSPEAFLESINSDNGYFRLKLYYWHHMPSPRERMVFNSSLQMDIVKRLKELGVRLATPTQNIITHTGAVFP